MAGSLHDVEAKIGRAKTHLADLADQTRMIDEACRETVRTEYDHQRAEHIVWLDRVPEIPPDFCLILGDAIHNLRTALDHLAWQIVLACNLEPREGIGGTNFPILNTPPTPDKHGPTRPRINPEVPSQIRDLLDEIQPYKRSKPTSHQLAGLHALDISDKHHELLVNVIGVRSLRWFGGADLHFYNIGPYQDGDEICRFTPADGETDPNFKPHAAFSVRIEDPKAGTWALTLGAQELIATQPLAYIEQEVLPRFAFLFA